MTQLSKPIQKKAKNCNYMGRIEKSQILISQYWYRDNGLYRFLGALVLFYPIVQTMCSWSRKL